EQHGGYPAGWYPLPDGTRERYWDGAAWTDAVRPVGGAPIPPPPAGPPPMSGQPVGPPVSQVYVTSVPNHGPAIASMVLGIVSFAICVVGPVTSIVGLVLGITSLKHVQPRGPKGGRGMAIAGIVLCAVFLGLLVLGLAFTIATSSSYD
ncbi:MAG: DUF4190 domain-containing protein, partial [Ilumatobacteraceae bacterium]